jgi:hypothetical protein
MDILTYLLHIFICLFSTIFAWKRDAYLAGIKIDRVLLLKKRKNSYL